MEEEAYPALDELTSQISTLNLERVRQIKNRLVALSGRVQKVNNYQTQIFLRNFSYETVSFTKKDYKKSCIEQVADQLEHLLDDDNDMAEMYLTQKLDANLMDQASVKEAYNSAFEEDIYQRCNNSSFREYSYVMHINYMRHAHNLF